MTEYSLRDFMSGEPLPVAPHEQTIYWMGVVKTSNKLVPFVCKSPDKIPENAIIHESGLIPYAVAQTRAEQMCIDARNRGLQPTPKSRLPRQYWFGVAHTGRGFVPFVCKSLESAPQNVVVLESGVLLSEAAHHRAEQLRSEVAGFVLPESGDPFPDEIVPGRIALFDDGDPHKAVILEIRGSECLAVFLTSKPDWAPVCRRATLVELSLLGGKIKNTTWLAGVVRPVAPFVSKRHRIPQHRVIEMVQEFARTWDCST